MYKLCLVVDTVDNTLELRQRHPSVPSTLLCPAPLTRSLRHVFYCWDSSDIYFTYGELVKMHRNFFHPSADKLFDLLRRARTLQASIETLHTLRKLFKACSTCRSYSTNINRFKVSIPDYNMYFAEDFALDIVLLDGKPVSHVVDIATHFGSAMFL